MSATVLGIGAIIADIIFKAGCSPIQDREEQLPLECGIIKAAFAAPMLIGSFIISFESVIFSYCRLYMIMPGISKRTLTKPKGWTSVSYSGNVTNTPSIP
jgi:hypothetical protein